MAGQHQFPSGYPGGQQSPMRNQFGGAQMMPGLIGQQQGGKHYLRIPFDLLLLLIN